MSSGVVIGIDAGGSTCRARAVGPGGEVVHDRTSGPANWASTPRDLLVQHLREALEGAPACDAVAVCIAGVLTDADRSECSRLVEGMVQAGRVTVRPDYEAVLAAADEATDLCILAGTGSLICCRNPEGRVEKGGGGGPLIGDQGSGFHLARCCLSVLVAQNQGLPTAGLRSASMRLCGSEELADLVRAVYRSESPSACVASLFPTVLLDMGEGHPYAQAGFARSMGELVEAVTRFVKARPYLQRPLDVGLAGGVFQSGNLSDRFATLLQEAPAIEVSRVGLIRRSPLEGALDIARGQAKA